VAPGRRVEKAQRAVYPMTQKRWLLQLSMDLPADDRRKE
jgi:hypothetical protein